MQVVIVGCGKVGSLLATLLAEKGHDVNVIDENPKAFERLGEGFNGRSIQGKGIDLDVLRTAGIEHADYLVAVTTTDNVNIMASEIAEEVFHVPHVLCRVHDTVREGIFKVRGLETISPTRLTALQIIRRMTAGASLEEGLPAGYEWTDVTVGSTLAGQTVTQAESLLGVRILFAHRGEDASLVGADFVLKADDVLTAVTRSHNPRLEEVLGS